MVWDHQRKFHQHASTSWSLWCWCLTPNTVTRTNWQHSHPHLFLTSGEWNCVLHLNRMIPTCLLTAEKENLWFYSSLCFVGDKLSLLFNIQISNRSFIWWRNLKNIDTVLHSPRTYRQICPELWLIRNKGSFCASITFPHEHKQSQTSAYGD